MTIGRSNISGSTFLICIIFVLSQRADGLKAPKDVKVQQIWPGQVQVVWSYENLRDVIFTVYHKAVNENDRWESKTVFEQKVVVLEGFRAHTNYTIKVAALRGDQKETSDDAYIYVREGVPWSPTELIFYKENKSAISYHLNWKTKNPENVDGYLILVAYENETVAIETSHTTYRFDGVLPEDAQYKIQVFAFNSVGKSIPAVVMVNPTAAKRRINPPYSEEPEYQPEYPQETLLYVLIPIGVVLVAALILLVIILIMRRKRERADDSAIYDEIPSQEPFFRPKNLPDQRRSSGTQTRSCAVQVSGDMPMDRVLNYAILTQNNSTPNDHNLPSANGYYSPNQFVTNGECDIPKPKCRLKKSDSISSYTRYDDVDTDCEEYMHNSSDDVLQTSHLDIPKTAVRFSPRLDDRKLLSRRVPIFPIENERIYCVVDIDRYKLHPNDLAEQDRLSPVY